MDLSRKIEIFRSRFHGRQDTYGRARKTRNKKGEEKTEYSPVCNNIWTDVCHIKRGTGVECRDCENQAWDPVSDRCVSEHISAHSMHNFFLMLDGGTLRFGAVDFDVKPGKEAQGYDFFEVQKFCRILKSHGINYGIARSTTAGYHVYMFFREPYPAARFRAVMSHFFSGAGFDEYVKEKIKPQYPEIFPKQDYVAEGFLGSGITPPMVEPLMMKGRKCWVDDDDKVIGEELAEGEAQIEAQWNYLEALGWTDAAVFDGIIDEYRIKVDEIEVLKKRVERAERAVPGMVQGDGTSRPFGHIEKVIFGCEAFSALHEKLKNGHDPSHDEGLALWNLAINTVDGREWFRVNVPTWGQTPGDIRELEYSVRHNYRPNSCEKMKEQGICHRDGFCSEAAPKAKVDSEDSTDGALEDLKEPDRRLHNPYRFAFAQGSELLHQLIKEADLLLAMEDADAKEEALRKLAERSQALDKSKLRDFRAHVERLLKPLKIAKNRVAPMFKEAQEKKFEKEQELMAEDSSVYEVGSFVYRKRFGDGKLGYYQITRSKNEFLETLLVDIDIIVTEERYYMDESGVQKMVYRGYAKSVDSEKPFEIDAKVWASDSEFQTFFTVLMGHKFQPIRKQIEHIKQAALGWCEKRKLIKTVSSLMTQGFYEGSYLMPSVTVDATGLRPTAPGVLEIGNKDVVRYLDWQILDDETFLETLRHLKDDFLVAWPAEWTLIGLAHVFRPLMMPIMNWQHYPTLFYDGLTGVGKSEITKSLQQFWGHFPALVNLTATQKYLEEMAYEFKDACLVLDDFKNLTNQQKNAVIYQIQYGYDGSSSGKLHRDSSLRKGRKNRSSIIMSGEDFIQSQASVVARTLLIEVQRFDNEETAESYFRVQKMCKNYNGITPRFLQWLLGRDRELLQRECEETRLVLYRFAKGRQNASRIAENISANHLTWKCFTSFMEDCAVINAAEREELNQQHWKVAQLLYHRMVYRCEEEQEASNFQAVLVSLILSGRVRVEGLKGEGTKGFPVDNPRVPIVGYVPNEADQTVGYYYPDAVIEEVNSALHQQSVQLGKRTVGRQLADLKIIKDSDQGKHTKLVRRGNGRVRVWVIDHVALQLVCEPPQEAEKPLAPVVPLRPGVQAMLDNLGLF
jgi:hypothetical protein